MWVGDKTSTQEPVGTPAAFTHMPREALLGGGCQSREENRADETLGTIRYSFLEETQAFENQ